MGARQRTTVGVCPTKALRRSLGSALQWVAVLQYQGPVMGPRQYTANCKLASMYSTKALQWGSSLGGGGGAVFGKFGSMMSLTLAINKG